MRRLSLFAARRRTMLAGAALFVVAAVLGAVLTPAPSEAQQSKCGTEIWYWSDATYTETVGLRAWTSYECGCQHYYWGSISFYRTFEDSYC